MGRKADVRSTSDMVQNFDDGQLIATHVRKPFGKHTDMSHYPPERMPLRCAAQPGVATAPPTSGRPLSL
jgi:hypothetical protein